MNLAPVIGVPAAALGKPEVFEHWQPSHRSPLTRIAVLALDNGQWQAMPPGFHLDAPQFASRDDALTAAVDAMVARAHEFTDAPTGASWAPPFAARVIEWALSLKGERLGVAETGDVTDGADAAAWPSTMTEKMVAEELTIAGYEASDAGAGLSDPVVRFLVEQHRLRRQFPAKHVFSMTLADDDGRAVSVATCTCKQVFKFGTNDRLRMDAAIEAHWRRFSHEKTLDGRGQPIKAEAAEAVRSAGEPPAKKSRRRRVPLTAEESAGAALPEPASSGGVGLDDAGSPSAGPDDPDKHRFWALLAIDAGSEVDGADVRDLVGVGYAHCTSTKVLVTDEGRAFLDAFEKENFPDSHAEFLAVQAENRRAFGRSQPAPIGAGTGTPGGEVTASPPRHVAEAGQDGTASASAAQPASSLAPADPAADEGASGDARSHAPPAVPFEASPIGGPKDEYLAGIMARDEKVGGVVGDLQRLGHAERTERVAPSADDGAEASEPPDYIGGGSQATRNIITSPDDVDDLDIAWPSYDAYLEDKIVTAPIRGIEVARDALHPWLKPHCKDLVVWALRLGCAAIFASFGLHKTAMQLEWCRQMQRRAGGATLNVVPLGVRHGFVKEALCLDMDVRFIRTDAEYHALAAEGVVHFLTNYESIREGKLDPNLFCAVSLDEASVLRSYGSKTFQEFLPLFSKVPFKLVATATPSPNRYKELIHYAGFLGVMDTGLALTRWFQRNSEKAGDLTLYEHKADEFWMWVHSWAIFLQKPSELCGCSCHSVKDSEAVDLAGSKSLSGHPVPSGTARGVADVTAETIVSPHQPTFSPDRSKAADASDQSMAESILPPTERGAQWSPGSTAIEKTTLNAEFQFASDGEPSPTSSPTWGNPHQVSQSSELKTTETTSPEIAAGPRAKSKRVTPGATSASATTGESRPSPLGPKSAASTISCSTPDTKSTGGQPQRCSATYCQRCEELDQGYELPPLKLTWHEVPADHSKAQPERDGQGVMFRPVANSLQDAAKSRRDSLAGRVAKMMEIIAADPDSHRVIWHDLEAEREAIEAALPGVVAITGSGMDIDERERRLADFEEGRTRHFATKPILSGSGSNFQYHCHKAIYVALPGYGYKFNDFIQSLYRLQRFGQAFPVEVDIIYSEDERAGRDALLEKWALDSEMRRRMSEIIRKHGLDTLPMRDAMLRAIGVKRVEVRGERFVAINNDTVAECRAWPENSVDQIITSIPFANQYEYTPSYNDFGHTDDTGHFWGQMDFLTPEWLRILKPGRLACVHVKDRVLFGAVTGEGVPTISPFHAEAIMHYRAHGFQFIGMITVVTDVVRENNQTYRLGWSENAKDGTKMGVGCPEYILLLRKPQSDRSRSYADVPVIKSKDDYTRARWQIDAHAFWRSSGNRHLTPEEFAACSAGDLAKLFAKATVDAVYDHEAHVRIGETHERLGTLPATFMAIAPGSHHPDVWHDVNRMRTLNMLQQRNGAEMHLCPLQFDIVDRLLDRYSNPGDLVLDPFGGLMTVPYRALLKGRRGAGIELNFNYWTDGVAYCRMAEEKATTPQLFDLVTFDKANAAPAGDLAEVGT